MLRRRREGSRGRRKRLVLVVEVLIVSVTGIVIVSWRQKRGWWWYRCFWRLLNATSVIVYVGWSSDRKVVISSSTKVTDELRGILSRWFYCLFIFVFGAAFVVTTARRGSWRLFVCFSSVIARCWFLWPTKEVFVGLHRVKGLGSQLGERVRGEEEGMENKKKKNKVAKKGWKDLDVYTFLVYIYLNICVVFFFCHLIFLFLFSCFYLFFFLLDMHFVFLLSFKSKYPLFIFI